MGELILLGWQHELFRLASRFYSQHGEDYLIFTSFRRHTDGFYVDIGALKTPIYASRARRTTRTARERDLPRPDRGTGIAPPRAPIGTVALYVAASYIRIEGGESNRGTQAALFATAEQRYCPRFPRAPSPPSVSLTGRHLDSIRGRLRVGQGCPVLEIDPAEDERRSRLSWPRFGRGLGGLTSGSCS
jgi:hypothetical protein